MFVDKPGTLNYTDALEDAAGIKCYEDAKNAKHVATLRESDAFAAAIKNIQANVLEVPEPKPPRHVPVMQEAE